MDYYRYPVYCHPWGTYVALPDSYPLDIDEIPDNEDGSDWVEPDGLIALSDDEDEASRILALRLHLDDFISKIEACGSNRFEVNPHTSKSGPSPQQIMDNCNFLRESFDNRLKLATAAGLKEVGYERAKTHIAPEALSVGIHRTLNTLHFVISGVESYVQAWNGVLPPDNRESYKTHSGEYLVLTDDEAEQRLDDYLESYIEDCMGLTGAALAYFDRGRFKADASIDGRGHHLATYDGSENYIELEDDSYYLYRTN